MKELERAIGQVGDAPRAAASDGVRPPPRGADGARPPRGGSLDDELAKLKRDHGGGPPKAAPKSGPRASHGKRDAGDEPKTVDDELAALKKKMAQAPPKKKP
jgi:hypothetical protein